MPTYDYRCEGCGHTFEAFQSIKADPLTQCPQCEQHQLRRLIGSGAGIIFKGSGFYETDYRSKEYKEKAKAEQQGGSTGQGGDSQGGDGSSGGSGGEGQAGGSESKSASTDGGGQSQAGGGSTGQGQTGGKTGEG
jgi:putative FmdB family regulatory protein